MRMWGNKAFRQAEGNDWRGVRMEQVTEAVKEAETTEHRERTQRTQKARSQMADHRMDCVSLAASGILPPVTNLRAQGGEQEK